MLSIDRLVAIIILFIPFSGPRGIGAHSDTSSSPIRIQVVDANTHHSVSDAVVTVAGSVIPFDPNQAGYVIPEQAIMVAARAPGYRAVSVPLSEILQHGTTVALTPLTVKALYLTEYGIAVNSLLDPALEIIHHGGANALVINIKSDHGLLPYPSKVSMASKIGARKLTTIPSLLELVRREHSQGIYMIARIVVFKDDPLAKARPDLAIHNANGSLFKDREHLAWTDPFQSEVRTYNIAVAVEAAQAGFDEVQFDYVRFPDATSKLKLSRLTDEANRVEAITSFLAEARAALVPYNTFESVALFGYVAWNTNDTGIGQHLEEITQIVDYVCPMLYPSGFKYGIPGHRNPLATNDDIYDTVKLSLDESLRRTRANPKKFRPWLQAFRDYSFSRRVFGPSEVATQIRAATDSKTDGWALWNARNQYGNAGLDNIADQRHHE